MLKAWEWPPASRLISPAIYTLVIAAGPSGASRRTGKFLSLRLWSPALPPIILLLRLMALCTSQAPQTPALTPFTASILTAQLPSFIADWDGLRASRLTPREISTSLHRWAASAAL